MNFSEVSLYTFKGDRVLDPFCGSGTTCLSAIKDGRHYIGYDVDEKYVKLADKRFYPLQLNRNYSNISIPWLKNHRKTIMQKNSKQRRKNTKLLT